MGASTAQPVLQTLAILGVEIGPLLRHRETISRLSRLCCGSGSSGENRVWASTAQPRQVLANNGVPNALVGSAALPVGMAKIKTGLTGDMTTLAVPEPIASLPKFYTSTMPAIHSVPRDPGVPYRDPPYGNPGIVCHTRAPLRPFRVRRAGLPMSEVCLVDPQHRTFLEPVGTSQLGQNRRWRRFVSAQTSLPDCGIS
jgi:hypothetical protein